MVATLTSKGQLTLPADLRKQLNLHAGDKVLFVVTEHGTEMYPFSRPVESLKSILPKPRKRLSLSEMDAVIAKGALS